MAVCWATPRQQWLLCNVTDSSTDSAEHALFVEVFTQGLTEDDWVWRDSYYPADAMRRSFWAHQFAEHGTPRSVELSELNHDWPQPQLPPVPARHSTAPQPGAPLRDVWTRLRAALGRL